MRRTSKALVAGLLSLLTVAPALAQTPNFPQNLPANSVVGRLGIGSGPAQAIPFSYFLSSLLAGGLITNLGLAQMPAATIKGNAGLASATPSDFTIQGLTLKSSPISTDMLLLWDSATGGFNKLAAGSFIPQAANTVLANVTGSSAAPVATTIPACANDGQHGLTYLNGSGFNCTTISTASSYPDFWNGSYSVWQRATVFTFTGGSSSPDFGQYTADNNSNGAGPGGSAVVQKYTLNVIEQAAITPSVNPPSTGMRMTFSTAPTSGGGSTGYPAYASFTESKGNNVQNYLGRQVTVSTWYRNATGQTNPFYIYIALGGFTTTGSSSNTISGTGSGCDFTSASNGEILCRSAKITPAVGPTWGRYSYTVTLPALTLSATFGPSPVVNIGIGMDYTDISAGSDYYLTATTVDYGPAPQPWREWPDEAKYALAMYNFQWVGLGATGFATSATTAKLSLSMKGVIKSNGSGGGGLFKKPSTNPIIKCGASSFTGSGSNFTVDSASADGLIVDVTGFTGLTAGAACVLTNNWLYSAQG